LLPWIDSHPYPQVKLLVSESQASGTYAKRASAGNKKDNAVACLCFLKYPAFLQQAADQNDFLIPWVYSRVRLEGLSGLLIMFLQTEESPGFTFTLLRLLILFS
jgi:hypothetical protein